MINSLDIAEKGRGNENRNNIEVKQKVKIWRKWYGEKNVNNGIRKKY